MDIKPSVTVLLTLHVVAILTVACEDASGARSTEEVAERLSGYWADTETRGSFVFHRFESDGPAVLSDGREDHLPQEWSVQSTDPIEIRMSGTESDRVTGKAVAEFEGDDALRIAVQVDLRGSPERPDLADGERLIRVDSQEAREIESDRLSFQAETRSRQF